MKLKIAFAVLAAYTVVSGYGAWRALTWRP